jgi:hypothetical protein
MKIVILCLLILVVPTFSYAGDFFLEKEISQLRLKHVDMKDKSAMITDENSNKETIFLGDRIGAEGWEIVEINQADITVQVGQRKMRLLKICGFSEIE